MRLLLRNAERRDVTRASIASLPESDLSFLNSSSGSKCDASFNSPGMLRFFVYDVWEILILLFYTEMHIHLNSVGKDCISRHLYLSSIFVVSSRFCEAWIIVIVTSVHIPLDAKSLLLHSCDGLNMYYSDSMMFSRR